MSTSYQTRHPVSKERHITYKELKQHSTYSDAWISINSVVYDITHFIDRHPFGDTFRGHLGTECGGLFSSAHTNTKVEEWLKRDKFLKSNVSVAWMHLVTNYINGTSVVTWIALCTKT